MLHTAHHPFASGCARIPLTLADPRPGAQWMALRDGSAVAGH